MTKDIRWIQRLSNWTRALSQLSKFMEKEDLDELQEQCPWLPNKQELHCHDLYDCQPHWSDAKHHLIHSKRRGAI